MDHATEGIQTKVVSQGEGECPSTAKSPTEGRKNGKGKSHAVRELLQQAVKCHLRAKAGATDKEGREGSKLARQPPVQVTIKPNADSVRSKTK